MYSAAYQNKTRQKKHNRKQYHTTTHCITLYHNISQYRSTQHITKQHMVNLVIHVTYCLLDELNVTKRC